MADDAVAARLQEAAEEIKAAAIATGKSMRVPGSSDLWIQKDSATSVRIGTNNGAARAYQLNLRHPLNWPHQNGWGNTPYRPFLSNAASEVADEVTETLSKIVNDYCEELGF